MKKKITWLNGVRLVVGGVFLLSGLSATSGQQPGSAMVRTHLTDHSLVSSSIANRWIQDDAENLGKPATAPNDESSAVESSKQGRDEEKENSLLDSLPEADLHAGITSNSMQRAVAKRDIADPNLNFAATAGPAPMSYGFGNQQFWKTWDSPNLYYRPLYFEEEGLERYGHSTGHHLQPYVSGVRFLGNVVMMPYKMTAQRPYECEYGLGYYRPGNCNPAFRNGF